MRRLSVNLLESQVDAAINSHSSSGYIVVGWDSAVAGVTLCWVTLTTLLHIPLCGAGCCTWGNCSFPKTCQPRQ